MYSVQNYECPSNLCPTSTPGNEQGILTVARAKLDGGGRLELLNWYGKDVSYQSGTASGSFDNVGVGANGGGRQSPIFPKDPNASAASYASCQAGGSTPSTAETQAAGSISYVPESNQYVLVFVCISPTNPATPDAGPESGSARGAALFYSTLDASKYDLSAQEHWSRPTQVSRSWQLLGSNSHGSDCVYPAWYPTLMSPGGDPGYLARRHRLCLRYVRLHRHRRRTAPRIRVPTLYDHVLPLAADASGAYHSLHTTSIGMARRVQMRCRGTRSRDSRAGTWKVRRAFP